MQSQILTSVPLESLKKNENNLNGNIFVSDMLRPHHMIRGNINATKLWKIKNNARCLS